MPGRGPTMSSETEHICGWITPLGHVTKRSECAACAVREPTMSSGPIGESVTVDEIELPVCTCTDHTCESCREWFGSQP